MGKFIRRNALRLLSPYCIDLIEGNYQEANVEFCKVFRPAHAKKA